MLWERIQFWVVLVWMVALLAAAVWAVRLLMHDEPADTEADTKEQEEPPSTPAETEGPPKDAP